MLVYKVVAKHNNTWMSGGNPDQKYALKYDTSDWTIPKIGKIFCFTKLQNAQNFAKEMYGRVVFEAEAEDVTSIEYVSDEILSIPDFWNTKYTGISAPRGSHVCTRLKLLQLAE